MKINVENRWNNNEEKIEIPVNKVETPSNKLAPKILIPIFLIALIYIFILIMIDMNNTIRMLDDKLIEERHKLSDEQIIVTQIKVSNDNIDYGNKIIKEQEELLRLYEAQKKCWANQMNRLIEWLEYNLNYCNDTNNLQKFEGLD